MWFLWCNCCRNTLPLTNGLAPPIKFTWIIEHHHPQSNRHLLLARHRSDLSEVISRLAERSWCQVAACSLDATTNSQVHGCQTQIHVTFKCKESVENNVLWQAMKATFSHMSNIVLLKTLGLKHTALQRHDVVQFQYCTSTGIRYIHTYFPLYNMHVFYKSARKNVSNICTVYGV